MYLKKGERVVYMGQDITAEKDVYVTLYGANHEHIDYLDELAYKCPKTLGNTGLSGISALSIILYVLELTKSDQVDFFAFVNITI